ncbi:isocitrate lyase/PEP mutase family protein [Kordiimonas sp.]|uniref:isocitrate lyase/PEP mutase family protein n=1 Tax=Kordiimonas sp. TaxID=1970157 RepID=UPI003A94138A
MNKPTPYAQMKALHQSDQLFLLPNAWDVPSAKAFAAAGFSPIGTSSWAIAAMFGYPDGEQIPFETLLMVAERIALSTDAMISVDVEAGYASDIEALCANISRVMAAGAVGINFEDSLKGNTKGLMDIEAQAERISAIKALRNASGDPVFLNARTDGFLVMKDDPRAALTETLKRAEAYAAAGADCLFVPFLKDESLIAELTNASPLPVNLLALPGVTDIARLQELGVRRLSLGNGVFDNSVAHQQTLAVEIKNMKKLDGLFA